MVANVDGQTYKRSENRIPILHHTSGRATKILFLASDTGEKLELLKQEGLKALNRSPD